MRVVSGSVLTWRANAHRVNQNSKQDRRIPSVFCAVLSEIHRRQWMGACHASSVVFWTLLRAQNIPAELCVGEVRVLGNIVFDHSWVEIDCAIYDPAISLGLQPELNHPPVFRGIDLQTRAPTQVHYGITSGLGYGKIVEDILDMSVFDYAASAPQDIHPEGLVGAAAAIAKREKLHFSRSEGRRVLATANWSLKPRMTSQG